MASSSSSSSGAPSLFAVKLYQQDVGSAFPTFLSWVTVPLIKPATDVPASIPTLISFNGNLFFWSMVRFGYIQTVPYVASADSTPPTHPQLSVVCNPQM